MLKKGLNNHQLAPESNDGISMDKLVEGTSEAMLLTGLKEPIESLNQ